MHTTFLLIGNLVEVIASDKLTENFTYADAVAMCRKRGTRITSSESLMSARRLGDKGCLCGWIEGAVVDSVAPRDSCDYQAPCKIDDYLKYVYCDASYELRTAELLNKDDSETKETPTGVIVGVILAVIVATVIIFLIVLYTKRNGRPGYVRLYVWY